MLDPKVIRQNPKEVQKKTKLYRYTHITYPRILQARPCGPVNSTQTTVKPPMLAPLDGNWRVLIFKRARCEAR